MLRPLEGFAHDVRYATRALRQAPTFAATAVLTLTGVIAINLGIFATLNAVAPPALRAGSIDPTVGLRTE